MKPSVPFNENRAKIREIISHHGFYNPRVFGSVLHGDDTEESDLDLLVDADESTSLVSLVMAQKELEELLGIKVDLMTPGFLPEKILNQVLEVAEAV